MKTKAAVLNGTQARTVGQATPARQAARALPASAQPAPEFEASAASAPPPPVNQFGHHFGAVKVSTNMNGGVVQRTKIGNYGTFDETPWRRAPIPTPAPPAASSQSAGAAAAAAVAAAARASRQSVLKQKQPTPAGPAAPSSPRGSRVNEKLEVAPAPKHPAAATGATAHRSAAAPGHIIKIKPPGASPAPAAATTPSGGGSRVELAESMYQSPVAGTASSVPGWGHGAAQSVYNLGARSNAPAPAAPTSSSSNSAAAVERPNYGAAGHAGAQAKWKAGDRAINLGDTVATAAANNLEGVASAVSARYDEHVADQYEAVPEPTDPAVAAALAAQPAASTATASTGLVSNTEETTAAALKRKGKQFYNETLGGTAGVLASAAKTGVSMIPVVGSAVAATVSASEAARLKAASSGADSLSSAAAEARQTGQSGSTQASTELLLQEISGHLKQAAQVTATAGAAQAGASLVGVPGVGTATKAAGSLAYKESLRAALLKLRERAQSHDQQAIAFFRDHANISSEELDKDDNMDAVLTKLNA